MNLCGRMGPTHKLRWRLTRAARVGPTDPKVNIRRGVNEDLGVTGKESRNREIKDSERESGWGP